MTNQREEVRKNSHLSAAQPPGDIVPPLSSHSHMDSVAHTCIYKYCIHTERQQHSLHSPLTGSLLSLAAKQPASDVSPAQYVKT